jgi:hypothetical protein
MYEQESDPHCNYRWLAEYGRWWLDNTDNQMRLRLLSGRVRHISLPLVNIT